jgi:hypothetical protein
MASIDAIVARVRLLIDDPSGGDQEFTDAEIQNALTLRRDEARYYPLMEVPSIASGGTKTYITFDAPVGDWETDVVLADTSYNVLSPATSDPVAGRWTFSTEPSFPVLITGFTYDLYGSSADLLMQWSTRESCAFDVSADGLSLARSQRAEMKQARAHDYYAKARTRSSNLVRTDEVT